MSTRTTRDEAAALVRAIDSASTPRAPFRKLHDLLTKLGDTPGTQVALLRLCEAEKKYLEAIEDAKYVLEIGRVGG